MHLNNSYSPKEALTSGFDFAIFTRRIKYFKLNFNLALSMIYVGAEEAVSAIKPGNRIMIPLTCGLPQTLVDALVEGKDRFKNIEIVSGLQVQYRFLESGLEDSFTFRTWQCAPRIRRLLKKGNVKYVPMRQGQVNQFFADGIWPINVALLQVTKPNEHGYCSLGVSLTHSLPAALAADTVIAEANDRMPWVLGDTFIHVSQLDYMVESSRPLLEYPPPDRISENDRKIANNVARLVPNGATIEIGIGSVPEAVLQALTDHKDLRFFGMATDGMIDLVQSGVVDRHRAQTGQAKITACEIMGTKRLFDYVDNNPLVEGRHSLIDPLLLSSIDKFVSIIGAIEGDITGQINSETIKGEQFSAVGGSFDWLQGASFSKGGRSIITLPSTTSDGKVSRIVGQLPLGTAVTHPRHSVQFVVTEYGIADLRGKSLGERAEALIAIAHPDFRDELMRSGQYLF